MIRPILVPFKPLNMVDLTESLKLKDQTYLPFLELLRKIGIFPCKRVRNEESGEITLVPTNGKLQLLLYCIVSSILSAAAVLTLILIQSSSGTNLNYLDFVIEYWKAGAGLQHSKFDLNIQGFFFLFLSIIHIVIQISLAAAKQDLCEVFNYLKLHGLRDNPMTNCVKKSCDWHLIKMGFCVFSFIIYLIGFAMKNSNHFNLNILTFLPHLTCWFIQSVWFLAPILSFHIYFLEISVMLLPWTWSLKEKLKESPSNYAHLDEAEKTLSSLEMISKAISKIIFWLFTWILEAIIICTYLMVTFFLNQEEFTAHILFELYPQKTL